MVSKRKESWESVHYKPHKWFAWYPVRVYDKDDGHHWRTVWLEWVLRSGHNGYSGWLWQYELVTPDPK